MKTKREKLIAAVYFLLYIAAALTLVLNQPLYDLELLSNPPDEVSRYKVPLYICSHGALPTGYEEELLVKEVDYTYGFYTLLPYIVQGYVMRFVNLFTNEPLALLYAARLTNMCIGLIMACVVILIGKRLFKDERIRWLFSFLVMLLPQSLFLHTYVNSDSMCLLSTALMIYGLIRGYSDGFKLKSCLILALGVILCALSYYNAYGFILSSVMLFAAYFVQPDNGEYAFEKKAFLRKGLFISFIVLLCISWQFVRNYLLYDGDFIGLDAKEEFMRLGGTIRNTHGTRGESLLAMLFGTTFIPKLAVSFISNYGSVTIYTFPAVYVFYLLLFAAGIYGMLFVRAGGESLGKLDRLKRIFVHANMVFCMLMPLILLIRYAYTIDYQAQGRYIMPGLIPFMYYVCRGLEKLPIWRKNTEKGKNALLLLLMAGITASLIASIYVSAMPVYRKIGVL